MSFKAVNDRLLGRALEFCEELLPGGSQAGDEYVCASLGGGAGRSCSINLKTGKWADFATDEQGGDLISLLVAVEELQTQSEGLERCRDWLRGEHETPERNTVPEGDDRNWWRKFKADHIWEYRDGAGELVCQVKRWNARPAEGRSKVIRPWNPATRQYEWPKSEYRPLLYTKAIQDTEDGAVVIVGGEKCADAITEVSWLGTTLMGGESAIAKADLSVLEDRDVILWPDNDAAGEEWSKKLTTALKEAEVKSVRVVTPPKYAPPKWDAADADKAERRHLLHEARHSQPLVRGLDFMRLDGISSGDPPEREWLVHGSILAGKPAVIFGPGGCGKSLAVMDLCLKLATADRYGVGSPPDTFLGAVPPEAAGPVIYVTLEDDIAEMHRRIHALDPGHMRKEAPYYAVPGLDLEGFDPTLVTQNGKMAMLTRLAEHGLPKLVRRVAKRAGRPSRLLALDPAGDFLGEENDASVVKLLMRYLRELATKHDMAVLLIGHDSKGQKDADKIITSGMRGSGAWTANARFAFGLWRPSRAQATRILKGLNLDPTDSNVDRVVFGRTIKANFPTTLNGQHVYLQDEKTGLLKDKTFELATKQETDAHLREHFLEGVKVAAEQGMPFCLRGGTNGLWENRERFPPGPTRSASKHVLYELGMELKEKGEIIPTSWGGRRDCLDVPGGPVVTNKAGHAPVETWTFPYEKEDD